MKMRSENRHYTRVWKKKRLHRLGDHCRNAKCGVCSPYKRLGNSKEAIKKKYQFNKKELLND